ncbi:MAG: hypothetical protein K9H64_07485 [Bacteroidales bacterium]|nr:hypothetical protein [Bacteroidales bacterium]MCF8455617.1 hypothetical protein [Bacteroidales bacterium]
MNDAEIRILGVLITDRTKDAGSFQYTLTKYGGSIKTRLGINIPDEKAGLLILELIGDTNEMNNLQAAIEKIEGVEIQSMVFD